jgi:aminomethyltransferase
MRTPLYDKHVQLNANMTNFAGWELPVQYTGIIEEHMAVRENVGIFDVSHMGKFIIEGQRSHDFLKSLMPTSMDKLQDGKAMYTCLCNKSGGVIDDIFIYKYSNEKYMIIANALNIVKVYSHLAVNIYQGMEISNITEDIAKLDLQGPKSAEAVKSVLGKAAANIPRFSFIEIDYEDAELIISRTGYTGEDGFELYIESDYAETLWDEFSQKGAKPCGLGARDSLRIEACYSLYGHELSDELSPIESGLAWLVNSNDNYIGKGILEKQKLEGVNSKLIYLEVNGKGIPRQGYEIKLDDEEIGKITSGIFSPFYKKGIAMALVKNQDYKVGQKLEIMIRDKPVEALVVKRPFYKFAQGSADS